MRRVGPVSAGVLASVGASLGAVIFRCFLGGLVVLGGPGCGAVEERDVEEVARYSLPILGGMPAPEPSSILGVVDFAGGQCSGSLILPNLVLTARHCIAATQDDPAGIVCEQAHFLEADSAGAVFVVPFPEVSDEPADYRAVREIHLPPGAGNALCGADVALLLLKEPLPLVPMLPRVDVEVAFGETYSAVGYGVDGSSMQGRAGVRRRLDGLSVVCAPAGCPDSEVRPTEWLGSTGVCPGDSGGPALDALGRVIGIVSRGKDGCTSPIYAAIPSYAGWLKDEALAASKTLGTAPPNWALGFSSDPEFHAPVGALCSSGTDCASNDCVDGTCTRACTSKGPCPLGYVCSPEASLCVRESVETEPSCGFERPRRGPGPRALVLTAALVLLLFSSRRRS